MNKSKRPSSVFICAVGISISCSGVIGINDHSDLDGGTDSSISPGPATPIFPNISSVAWNSCPMPTTALSVSPCVGGGCLDKVEIDTALYPDAVCNDGSPGVMYIRPAPSGSADEDKWVVHLEGGAAAAEPGDAVGRWCNDAYYDASKMSSSWTPDQIDDRGIFADRTDNNFAEWNQVFMYYCSSDQWLGRTQAAMVGYAGSHASTIPQNFTVEFRGFEILTSAIRTLQPGGLSVDGEPLRALDDATHMLLTGSSAGGGGAWTLADRMRNQLRLSNPNLTLRLVVDSAVQPIESWVNDLVYPGGIPPIDDVFIDMADYEAKKYARAQIWNALADGSCTSAHSADPESCANPDHLLANHVTTPFFVRQDLDEKIPNGADPQLWSEETHAHLTELADLLTTAEEATNITVVPGVFAPQVGTHTSLDSPRFFDETVSGLNFHDVLLNWMNDRPDSFILENP